MSQFEDWRAEAERFVPAADFSSRRRALEAAGLDPAV